MTAISQYSLEWI